MTSSPDHASAQALPRRPWGLWLIVILTAINGILSILLGLLAILAIFWINANTASLPDLLHQFTDGFQAEIGSLDPNNVAMWTTILGFTSLIFVVLGSISLGLAWGLWQRRRWAWVLMLLLQGLSLVTSLANLGVGPQESELVGVLFGLGISLAIGGYLAWTPVRRQFWPARSE
jgi:hypothetical protein